MTYCIGVKLDDGMIFASDSRTNAGLDNIARFCKMTVFERKNNRVVVLLSSGNLAGTQAIISVLTQRCFEGRRAAQRRAQAQDIEVLSVRIDDHATFAESVHERLSCLDERILEC